MTQVTWQNWSGRQTAAHESETAPASEQDIVDAVRAATDADLNVRAVGASHSHSRIAAPDGVLLRMDGWSGVVSTDAEKKTARVRSGSRIFELGPPLFEAGLALHNQGDIDKQSISGAIATGTHGTGPTLGNLSSSVRGVRLVLGSGEVVECSADIEPDLFEVARHNLGGVGIVTEVDLEVRDAYRLHERQWLEAPEDVFERIDDLVAATRHFEFFWMPQNDRCAAKSLAETDAAPDPLLDEKYQRIGWSHEIISSIRDDKHTEMEYSVPAVAGPACFLELRAMIQADFPDLAWPLEYRTLRSDDLWISTASGRETVTISAHQDITLDDRPLFEACEAVFRTFEGRPHWGKVHYRTASELAALHPRYEEWWQTRNTYDPTNTFLTEYLRTLHP